MLCIFTCIILRSTAEPSMSMINEVRLVGRPTCVPIWRYMHYHMLSSTLSAIATLAFFNYKAKNEHSNSFARIQCYASMFMFH